MKPRAARTWTVAGAAGALAACWLWPATTSWRLAPDLGHSWVVPLLMAYLWWERWTERPAAIARRGGAGWWGLALALVAVALPLRLLLEPFPLWPSVLSLYTAAVAGAGLAAAWLIAGRPGVRWFGGPLILLVSVLPVPTALELWLIGPLRTQLAAAAAEVCTLFGVPALALGTSVRLANGWVGIDEACGGIRSLQACVMVGLFFGAWYRFGWGRRATLLLVGVAMAVAGNFARVLFLALRTSAGMAAVESAHDASGWVAMAASVIATGLLAWRWGGCTWPNPGPPGARTESSPGFGFGHRWLVAVAAGFVALSLGVYGWFNRGVEDWSRLPQWTAVLPRDRPGFASSPLGEPAREMLRPDFFVAGNWLTPEGERASAYYIEWHRGQIARTVPFAHNPTVCLPFAGCELEAEMAPITVSVGGVEVTFLTYRFRRLGQILFVAFTIWDPLQAHSLAEEKLAATRTAWWRDRWEQVARRRRDQPAQLLAASLPWGDHAAERMHYLLKSMMIAGPDGTRS